MTLPVNGAERGFTPYDIGRTPATACRIDQRFSYCLYVPSRLVENPAGGRILAAVHGTDRGNQALRDLFIPYAEATGSIILAPLFPCGIGEPQERDNYKYIEYQGIRFDHLLLDMVAEVAARYGVEGARFDLFGFSGGAHFAHRFLYLHPGRLRAVSVGAPGSPTLLDTGRLWWLGVADMEQRFGVPLDLDAMRKVRVHLAVGSDDTDTWEITHTPGSRHWLEGANDAGATRVERLHTLAANLADNGIDVRLDILDGFRHSRDALVGAAIAFLNGLAAEGGGDVST
jgi:pimeloyl-ACP methyl ester carboxylesterase